MEKFYWGGAGPEPAISILELLPDGSIDESFGTDGFAFLNFSQYGLGEIWDIKVQTDGKIIAGCNMGSAIMLARFKPDGTLDSSFGTNGTSRQTYDLQVSIFDVQIQPDGKYVAAGYSTDNNFNHDIEVLRFNEDGSPDKSFGKKGEVIISQNYGDQAFSVALQSDGKILIGGEAWVGVDNSYLARLNADGSLDAGFGTGGTLRINAGGGGADYINSIALLPDGKIVTAGIGHTMESGNAAGMIVMRFTGNGQLDEQFGNNGTALILFDGYAGAEANNILVQPDGKLAIAGTATNQFGDYVDVALARLKEDGSIDSSFGINGKQTTTSGGGDRMHDAVLQPDGKIVVAGESMVGYFSAFRYLNDNILPLHITYFNAITNNHAITLNWQTAQENNNNYFAVERSGDSRFSRTGGTGSGNDGGGVELTRITSQGNSSQLQTYSYTDNTPLQGINFYRLKQVDKDGKFSYSQVVSATIENGLTVILYPNPVKDVLNIKGLDAGMSYELSVMNAKGDLVAQTSISNTSSYSWNLQNLSKSVYYLTCRQAGLSVISTNNRSTVKFVKE